MWEEAEWLGRLRKERERSFPQTKKKISPGLGYERVASGPLKQWEDRMTQGEMGTCYVKDIRPKGFGLPASPETPVSHAWRGSSRENPELTAPHRWNDRALRGD